jgi:archaellum biogenesis ATPase FlaH
MIATDTTACDLASQLRSLGYDVKPWYLPEQGMHLQVTEVVSNRADRGMTLYVPASATLAEAFDLIASKRRHFLEAA